MIKTNNFTRVQEEVDPSCTIEALPTTQLSLNYNVAAQRNRKKGSFMLHRHLMP